MRANIAGLLLLASVAALGAGKKAVTASGVNEDVELSATVLADRESIQQALGSDLGGQYIVVDVKVASRFGKEISVSRDDFLLRTDKDGDKARPFAPSQIAGRGALVISETGRGGAVMGDSAGPVWGGYPGSTDRPRRLGGEGGAIGNAGAASETRATLNTGSKDKPNPLLQRLEEKILPEKKTEQALSGLLYFPMEKQKLKDLELIYNSPSGKISLRFR